jgi:hypothetical protein
MRVLARLILLLAAVLAAPLPSLAQANPAVTRTISADNGGEVSAPSGRATLSIPAAALAADTQVSIAELPPEGGPVVGPVYDIKPDGLDFLHPATLTIRFAPGDLPEGCEVEDLMIGESPPPLDEAALAAEDEEDEMGPPLLETTVDQAARTASAQLQHLSLYTLRALTGYRLGEVKQLATPRPYIDFVVKYAGGEGEGEAYAECSRRGELTVKAAVSQGHRGGYSGTAMVTKLFRVKAGRDGRQESNRARLALGIAHGAHVSAFSNYYITGYCVTLCEWSKEQHWETRVGRPSFHREAEAPQEPGHLPISPVPGTALEGMMFQQGCFNRNFARIPLVQSTTFPMGPAYRAEDSIVAFEHCHLQAGHVYGVTVSVFAVATGLQADDYGGPAGAEIDYELPGLVIGTMTVME